MSANNKHLSPYQGTELFSKFLSNYQSLLIALFGKIGMSARNSFNALTSVTRLCEFRHFGKDYKSLTNFWRFITYLAKSWA